jgi:SPP1 gp7 family putative phage head morphogenesis protein
MGLLDLITRAQEKLQALQEKINNTRLGEVPKEKSRKAVRPSVADQTKAQCDSFIRNGFDEYEFVANRDCCSLCGELNGKHFRVSDLVIGVNAPPMHDGCRCSIAAYSDQSEYDEWLDFLSKGGTTKEFKKRK